MISKLLWQMFKHIPPSIALEVTDGHGAVVLRRVWLPIGSTTIAFQNRGKGWELVK